MLLIKHKRKFLKKIIYLFILSILNLNATNFNLKNITLEEISNKKEWKQLLYMEDNESEVINEEYFLSKNKNNLMEELILTINEYKENNVNNNDAVCKFPARYLFLSKFVNFPNYKKINENCTNLKKWIPLTNTDSISLVLVSGYVSNPASTFGHSFIKLNNKQNSLFDTSINFGAMVPENENMIKYIYNGLNGNYDSGFSDKYYYEQDLVYSNKEYRDMWEYKLNLTNEEKDLILFHLYEVLTKKYKYYFLNKNCGYRVSGIVNLISNKRMINNDNWYLPIETFSYLEEIEKEKIKEIKYIPSNKRIFNFFFDKLSTTEKNTVINFINTKTLSENITEEEKINVLDFLLIYYKNTINIYPENKEYKKELNIVIKERLKLKASEKKEIVIKEKESPAKNTNPIDFKLGYSKKSGIISFSPYKQSFLDNSNLDFDELSFLNTTLKIEKNLELKKFDFIKIQKINNEQTELLNDNLYSWKLNIGIENNNKYYLISGIGYFFNEFNLLSMVDLDLNKETKVNIVPHINIYNSFYMFKNQIEIGYKENNLYVTEEIQYNISNKQNIGIKIEKEREETDYMIYFKVNF